MGKGKDNRCGRKVNSQWQVGVLRMSTEKQKKKKTKPSRMGNEQKDNKKKREKKERERELVREKRRRWLIIGSIRAIQAAQWVSTSKKRGEEGETRGKR